MQSQEPSKAGAKARRCVQRSLLMRLQDAIAGPSVILSFKSQFGFLITFAAARPQARDRAAPWPGPASDIPPKLPVRAGYPFLSPGVATRRERRGFYAWL